MLIAGKLDDSHTHTQTCSHTYTHTHTHTQIVCFIPCYFCHQNKLVNSGALAGIFSMAVWNGNYLYNDKIIM